MSFPSKSMLSIETINAPVLAAAMTCSALFGITCSQTAYYFRMYPDDHIFLKAVTAVLFIMEGAQLAFLVHAIHYLYVVCKMPEKTLTAFDVPLGSALTFAATVIITTTVQSFYAWRIYRLSAGRRWRQTLVAFTLVTSLAQLAIGLRFNSLEYTHDFLENFKRVLPQHLITVYLVINIVCDVTISASLVYFLNNMRTGFRTSENVVNRLVMFSLGNGVLTSIIASCIFVTYYVTPSSSLLYTFFIYISPKLYVNSMLVALNSRKRLQKMFAEPRTGETILLRSFMQT